METIQKSSLEDKDRLLKGLHEAYAQKLVDLDPKNKKLIDAWFGHPHFSIIDNKDGKKF